MGRSSYPGQIDSDVELPYVADNVTEIGAEAINSLRDAIFSIEEAIGANPQGNLSTFVARINKVIDNNGLIKTSALAERGLVTLPIADVHIGDTAAIKETKLDLDHTTAELYAKIVDNEVDLEALRISLSAFILRTSRHFIGVSDRHDGYQIDLLGAIRSSEDVETAMHVINNVLTDHLGADSIGVHAASNVSVVDEFDNFSATDVQAALVELDKIGSGKLEAHQDSMHTNGVALNERGEQGSQGSLKETILASTIFQTEASKATNILQVMRPNVARVTSENMNLGLLSIGSSNVLRVQAGGVERDALDIDLSAIIPVESLDKLVETINQVAQGCENHYPIMAYNTSGKLTIAHTMAGEEFTIQIRGDVGFSAAGALGFGGVTTTVFSWANNNHHAYVGGQRIQDFKSLVKIHYTHDAKPASLIAPGLGDLADLGLTIGNTGRIPCHITNHSINPDDNGTHYIIAFPNQETFVLSADITFGDFDLEIVANGVNFQNSANGEIYDIFVEPDEDGYALVSKYNRLSYGVIGGLDLVSVSLDFPTIDMEWQVSDSSSIQLFSGGFGGVAATIPAGFQGRIEVFAPDNVNSAIVEVTGVPSNLKRSMDVAPLDTNPDKLYISSVHYAGNHGLYKLKYVVDKRDLGCVPRASTDDPFNLIGIEEVLKGIRNNGVIRGLDVVTSDTNSLYVRGGQALVDGRLVKVETQDVSVNEFGVAKRMLLLDKYGKFLVKSEFDPGYAFADLISGDAYGDDRGVATIAEFETNGSAIDGYVTDRRLMIGNIDKQVLNKTAVIEEKLKQIQNTVKGSMWGFTIANSSGSQDGYLASLEVGNNHGFSYIPSGVGWWDQEPISARGFLGGQSIITTRRFEFSDPDTIATSIFRALGLTHINVFVEAIYSGTNGGPFAVSGTSYIDVGVAVETGINSIAISEEYARAKTFYTGTFPADSVLERYVASIPVSQLNLPDDVMFDVVPRVRIINSNFIDGSTGSDLEPIITFNHIRIVTSSYSIAGRINSQDGSSAPLAARVGEVL